MALVVKRRIGSNFKHEFALNEPLMVRCPLPLKIVTTSPGILYSDKLNDKVTVQLNIDCHTAYGSSATVSVQKKERI
jgi:hypothetical protein